MDVINYALYIKRSPLADNVYKIGIMAIKHIHSRLGTYQNAFGPTYQERFECVWIGPELDIRELERLLKIKYRNKIAGLTRGYTEWITDITYGSLVIDIQNHIDNLGVIAQSPKGFGKIFEEDIGPLQDYIKILMESNEKVEN